MEDKGKATPGQTGVIQDTGELLQETIYQHVVQSLHGREDEAKTELKFEAAAHRRRFLTNCMQFERIKDEA